MVLVWFGSGVRVTELSGTGQVNRQTRLRPPWTNLAHRSRRLFLEEPVRGDGDGHFSRFWVNEIRQRENHAVDDPADHGDDRQKAEQAGHVRASGGVLTVKIIGDGRV